MNKKELLENLFLNLLDDYAIFEVVKEYQTKKELSENLIYLMWDFDDLFSGEKPLNIIRKLSRNFDCDDKFFTFSKDDFIVSYYKILDYVKDYCDLEEIIEYILDENDDLGCDEIREILDEEEI